MVLRKFLSKDREAALQSFQCTERLEIGCGLLLDGSDGGGGGSVTLLCGAEHECLVDPAMNCQRHIDIEKRAECLRSQTLRLILSLLKSRLQLALSHLQVPDVGRRTIQQGNLARLLVRNGQGLLQTAVAVPELVTSALLRLNTLAADFLTATILSVLNESQL